jgi:pantetheine-phosphate adenylyltransferase
LCNIEFDKKLYLSAKITGMDKIAIFPGSFDPFTVGHEAVVKRALSLFDTIYVAVGVNTSKKSFFTLENRLAIIAKTFEHEPKVKAISYEGLTVELCKSLNAQFLLRGLRTSADFEFERAIGQVNKAMNPAIETVFLLTAPEHTPINSTIVRDILLHKGDASQFLPKAIDINSYLPR